MNVIATFFGVGYLRYMPGTIGSFAAVVVGIPIVVLLGQQWLLAVCAVFTLLYFLAVPRFIRVIKRHDPECVVADEVVAQWLIMSCLPEIGFFYFSLGFVLFRIFDILKPYPINFADRESRHGSYGRQAFFILFDDILAAIFTIICIYGFNRMAVYC